MSLRRDVLRIAAVVLVSVLCLASSAPVSAHQQARDRDIDLLARLISAESRGEPYVGQVAVGAVVLNRVESKQFPGSISGVIFQDGGRQFESVLNGSIYAAPVESARKAARDAMRGWDPSKGAIFFFNPAKTRNKFLWARPHAVTIAKHRFTY